MFFIIVIRKFLKTSYFTGFVLTDMSAFSSITYIMFHSYLQILKHVREAAKKVLLLKSGPLRPYPPPPLGLNGHRTLFFSHKIAGNGF